ncbi:MAG TPA: glycosyltransferase [Bryobacteraceae bacterium]|nr:glycosyltransferase [Bryobacteraceae bacterium]
MPPKPIVHFVYFDAGGGHRSAANALESVVASKNYGWDVRLVNLQQVLDSLDIFRKITGIRMEDIYNLILAKGWTLGSSALLPVMHGIIRLYHPAQVDLLQAFWRQNRPDMVVSLIPNFNRAIFDSLHQAGVEVPLVTIPTDLADYPPHFWMENQPQYFICGTHKAVEQALNMGHPKRRVFQVSGMILRPEFYAPQEGDRREERQRIGLDPDLPTGFVLFGGEGSNVMFPIAQRLGNSSTNLQLILICGRNRRLRERLKTLKTPNTLYVEGFTQEIPYYMHLSDFFVGKPGPGSISESLKMNLPVIVERNSWTLPQERYNADWVKEQGVGIVLQNFRAIEPTVKDLLEDGRLDMMRRNIACVENRAVFEIPPILAKILAEHPL